MGENLHFSYVCVCVCIRRLLASSIHDSNKTYTGQWVKKLIGDLQTF